MTTDQVVAGEWAGSSAAESFLLRPVLIMNAAHLNHLHTECLEPGQQASFNFTVA